MEVTENKGAGVLDTSKKITKNNLLLVYVVNLSQGTSWGILVHEAVLRPKQVLD